MAYRIFLSTLPARGATQQVRDAPGGGGISIHAPREGSDPSAPRGADTVQNFYPRSPRGERQQHCVRFCGADAISIHAPREGSDRDCGLQRPAFIEISIHAPREGSDLLTT